MIQVITIFTDKPEVDQIDVALLVEELIEIYSTRTAKGWCEAEKMILLIDWLFTIAGVQYLYLESKHESCPNMTYYNSLNKRKHF